MLTPIELGLHNPDHMVDEYPIWEMPPGFCWGLTWRWEGKPGYQLHPETWHQMNGVIWACLNKGAAEPEQYPKARLERKSF